MNLKKQALFIARVAPVLALLSGCAMFKDEVASVKNVDDLVARVEDVHLEAELSRSRVRGALDGLHTVVSADFAGDPVVAFETFLEAIDSSEEQAKSLRNSVEPMRESANVVFAKWEADLLAFSIPEMRNRSRDRMESTRKRYQDVVDAVELAQSAYGTFNLAIRDHATFLGNDFNAAAVSEIRREVEALTEWGHEVDRRLELTMEACEIYVENASLPGTVQVEGSGAGAAPAR